MWVSVLDNLFQRLVQTDVNTKQVYSVAVETHLSSSGTVESPALQRHRCCNLCVYFHGLKGVWRQTQTPK